MTNTQLPNKAYLFVPMFLIPFLCIGMLLTVEPAQAKTVYDDQSPMTNEELLKLIDVLPRFRAWCASNNENASPGVSKGKPDFVYSEQAAKWVEARGWDARRFFSVMGRAAAALYIVGEGKEFNSDKPSDMPSVTESELEIVRNNLGTLLQAIKDTPPINQ